MSGFAPFDVGAVLRKWGFAHLPGATLCIGTTLHALPGVWHGALDGSSVAVTDHQALGLAHSLLQRN